jgi:hypothetical protein
MINVVYGVFNAAGGGGGFTPAYYTPNSFTSGWANPENAYDGTGVAQGSNTGTTTNPNNGAFEYTSSEVVETYGFASLTGFSQIQINGNFNFELTSAATQYLAGSGDPEIIPPQYVRGTAQFLVQLSTNGGDSGGTWTTIELRNKNTSGNPPVGGTVSGSAQSFNSTINSGSAIALPANLNSLKIRLISRVFAEGYRNSDGNLYEATGLSENQVYDMTVYVS